ncbi:MAG: lamin tail domain-containing protein [Nonlabens sp.]
MNKVITVFAFALAIICNAQSAGDVIVTEIMFDPSGSREQDREWFEVYNTTNVAIDMNGWTLVDKSSSGRSETVMSSAIVQPNSYAVFVYNDDITVAPTLANTIYEYGPGTGASDSGNLRFNNESTYAGDNGDGTDSDGSIASDNDDGVELLAPNGDSIDTVVYGFGYNGLPAWPAQGAADAVSYQLNANALTAAGNDDAANWVASTNLYTTFDSDDYFGTPGAANFATSNTPTFNVGDLIVTEIMFDPASGDEEDREWFEVYNTTNSPIDMNGWTLGDNSSGSRDHVISSMNPVIVPANSYAVLVYLENTTFNPGITNAIYEYGSGTPQSADTDLLRFNNESTYSGTGGSTNDDGVELIAPDGTSIDSVEYGFGYNGLNAWPDQGASEAVSYQLYADQLSSTANDNAANWVASTNQYSSYNSTDYFGTPGAANFGSMIQVIAEGDIILTEFMIDPNGSEGNTEYIEIYNTTNQAIDIQGWILEDESSNSRDHEIISSVIVPANGYAVLAPSTDSNVNGGISNVAYAYGFTSSPGGTPDMAGTSYPRFNNESSFDDSDTSDNETDGITLVSDTGLIIDYVEYDYGYGTMPIGWPAQAETDGASYELGFSYFDSSQNDQAIAWNRAISSYDGSDDLGTPGAANDYNRVYTYADGWQAPFNDPNGTTNATADIKVTSGTAIFTSNTSFRNLNIETSMGFVTLNTGVDLAISGDLDLSGNLDATSGTLSFLGDSAQLISGLDVVLVGDMVIDNAAGLQNSAIIDLTGTLDIQAGNLNNAGTFTFIDDMNNTAIIEEIPSGSSLIGTYKTQTFIPVSMGSLGRKFRFVSSSVNTSSSIYANWQEAGANVANNGTHITGTMGATGMVDMSTGFDQTPGGNPSLFQFSNDTNQNWAAVSSTNQIGDELNVLDAYRIFIRGDRDPARINGEIQANATTLSATGQVNQGDQERTFDVDGGQFVLVGNPYQSTVDLETVLSNSTNLNNDVAYYWDPSLGGVNGQGAYTLVTGFASGGSSSSTPSSANTEFLQPGQSVFFAANAGADGAGSNAVVRFRESDKSTASTLASGSVFSMNNSGAESIRVNLYDTMSYDQGGTVTDGVMMRFAANYSDDIDDQDFVKFYNIDETLAVMDPEGDFAIYSRSGVVDGLSIPLRLVNHGDLSYTFEIELTSLVGYDAYLVDALDASRTILTPNTANRIDFTVDPADPASIADLRFSVEFETATLSTGQDELAAFSLYPNPAKESFAVATGAVKWTSLEVYNSVGQLVLSKDSFSDQVSIEGLVTGTYFVKVNQNERTETIQLMIE